MVFRHNRYAEFDRNLLFGPPLFTLNSGYLTGSDQSEQVEVQGFLGGLSGTKLFNNIDSVNSSSPTLATFDYVGVDPINIISVPSNPDRNFVFVPDNLTVDANLATPEASTIILVAAGLPTLPIVGHRKRRRRIA